jgi:hypothetical protein
MVRPVPDRAEPIASPSQLFLAILVEPMPKDPGIAELQPSVIPYMYLKANGRKIALSLSISMP